MDMAEATVTCYDLTGQSGASATPTKTTSEYKECANCGVNDTPLWRKYNDHDLCNACVTILLFLVAFHSSGATRIWPQPAGFV